MKGHMTVKKTAVLEINTEVNILEKTKTLLHLKLEVVPLQYCRGTTSNKSALKWHANKPKLCRLV